MPIGECPRCGKMTFIVHEGGFKRSKSIVEQMQEGLFPSSDTIQTGYGHCYACGYESYTR